MTDDPKAKACADAVRPIAEAARLVKIRPQRVIGKRITGIKQTRFWDSQTRRHVVSIDSIQLDNGMTIILHSEETETDPYTWATVQRTEKSDGR